MSKVGRSVTNIRWTATAVSDGNAPDTDTILYVSRATTIFVQWDTTHVTTGAPTIDLHVEASYDGVTWTTHHYHTIDSAVLKNVVDGDLVTPGPKQIRFRLDVNTANIAATEYVRVDVFIISED